MLIGLVVVAGLLLLGLVYEKFPGVEMREDSMPVK